jgi:hypothetical protein
LVAVFTVMSGVELGAVVNAVVGVGAVVAVFPPALVQEVIFGRALLLPLNMVVKPKAFPEPLDCTVMTSPLPPPEVATPFQTVDTFCGAVIVTTTVHVLAPLTATVELYRSPQAVPAVNVAVQLPEVVAASAVWV